jgi:ABC-type multidrug transport system ATPase subunit
MLKINENHEEPKIVRGLINKNYMDDTVLQIDSGKQFKDVCTQTVDVGQLVAVNDEIKQVKQVKQVTLTWDGINAYLPSKIAEKHIIKDVDGIAKPKKIMAIMGASGAGKTTLLNALNFRNSGKLKVYGDIKVNGQTVWSQESLAAISGYVQQDDLFIGTLRVKEHLMFQARLRMNKKFTLADRVARVEEVLNDLNLKKCENTLIGDAEKGVKGISGGEKRRLAFASEIITDPMLLFCDEPTSGLDSFMAQAIVESMKNLAQQGRTIICTIHQPSSEVFEMFDNLCLLAEGRLAYIGQLQEAYDFFASIDYVCPKNYNPADYYIHKLSVVPAKKDASKAAINSVCDQFEKSKYKEDLQADIDLAIAEGPKNVNLHVERSYLYRAGFFTQLKCLMKRDVLSLSRDPFQIRAQFLQVILVALLFGAIFFKIKLDQQGVQNINGVLFLFITNASFFNLFPVINLFSAEVPIFLRGVFLFFLFSSKSHLILQSRIFSIFR